MLNAIKSMINSKKEFMEAADIIFEDGSGKNLDDLIVLGESVNNGNPIFEDDHEEENEPDEDESKKDDDNHDDDHDKDDDEEKDERSDDDINNMNIDDSPAAENPPAEEPNDDILGGSIDGSDLPTPVGNQTGEPIEGNIDDILGVEIDLKSNTIKDILPVPPANAGEAIAGEDDIMSQKVDSGFGSEEGEGTEPSNSDDPMTEAITLDGDGSDSDKEAPADGEGNGDDSATDTSSAAPADTSSKESDVTAAVRDKVAEIEDPTTSEGEESSASKDELLKKLGNITKSLEDAKKAVMNSIK